MDRIINVKVGGNYISKDNKNAGVKGEGNVTSLRITFDEGWRYYAKTVTFFDALGGNPVKRMLTVDLIEDITTDALTYITPIPPEPLAITGEMTFVIDGFYGEFVKNADGEYEIECADKSKRQRSIADKLVVKDAPNTDTAGEPTDPTPTEPEQWQSQVDKIIDDIQKAAISRDEAAQFAEDASGAADWADSLARNAQIHELNAYGYARTAKGHELNAYGYATKAETALTHNPVIVDGNWHVWDATTEQYKDTGVKAQAGSTVYYGDNPPDNADVWIDPEGESAMLEIKNYIDEQTEILKSDVEGLQAQINEEAHFRGYLPTNAKIKALKATPNDFAYSAESGTKWVYDAESGWIDTGKPVPDQLTPASETTPLINGTASVGTENAYARGDHRHPTDTTREDKNNKIDILDLDNPSQYEDSGKYPTAYAVAEAIIENGLGIEQSAILTAKGYTNHKVGELANKVNSEKEDKSNKVAELTADSTDEQYPSAKAVKKYVAEELEGKQDKIESPESYFTYKTNDNAITITGLTDEGKAATEINIPPTINDLPVVACAAESFRDNTNLVSVSIPYGVIESGVRQFLGCTNLRSVKLPYSLTNIASHMFYRCTNLTSISIPDSVTAIGDRAFAMCKNFKSTVVIPEGITELKERIFTGCVKLKKVVLPKTLKVIEDNMFGGCYELVNIEIPNGVTSIGAVSFYECKVLEELFIPDSVTYIGDRAFELCEKLTIVCNAGSYAEAYAIENGIPYKHTELERKLSNKEDKSNKVAELTADSTDEQYPSAKATFTGIKAKTNFELIKSDTLSEDIDTLTVNFDKKYKELYVRMIITTMNPEADTTFPTGRVAVYVANTIDASKQVFMENNPLYKDNGVSYPLNFHIELFGKYCRVHRQYATTMDNPQYTSSATLYTGYRDIGQEYFGAVTLYYLPNTRKFPVGTYYEIWGVRA